MALGQTQIGEIRDSGKVYYFCYKDGLITRVFKSATPEIATLIQKEILKATGNLPPVVYTAISNAGTDYCLDWSLHNGAPIGSDFPFINSLKVEGLIPISYKVGDSAQIGKPVYEQSCIHSPVNLSGFRKLHACKHCGVYMPEFDV